MMYPFMTLNDDTEITHSEMKDDGTVKVYIETPDEKDGFHNVVCWLPDFKWEKINGYSDDEMRYFKKLIQSLSQKILTQVSSSQSNPLRQSSIDTSPQAERQCVRGNFCLPFLRGDVSQETERLKRR
ncbi:MAG: hypothetical protein IJQ57_12590 [Synergistaceae bacterium]|nr:hypothetical protein [Synergistaceae bacterium]